MTARSQHDPILDVCRVVPSPVTLANGLITTAQQELDTASEQILWQTAEGAGGRGR